MVSRKKKILSFVITALGLLALFLVAVNTGSLKVTPLELFKGLFIEYNENVATIYDLRFPRILIAIFGGAATAVSGVLLQAVMKNPLADPGIIGVSSGASLTADQAKQIALQHAGVAEADASRMEIGFDYEHGRAVYEIEWKVGWTEYNYEIDANTGDVLSYERDMD